MQKEKLISGSIFCLSIALVISSLIIADGMKVNGDYVGSGLSKISSGLTTIGINLPSDGSSQSIFYSLNTYDFATTASYLGINESKLTDLVNAEHSGIPYIKIGETYIFSKNALDKWLETARVEIK